MFYLAPGIWWFPSWSLVSWAKRYVFCDKTGIATLSGGVKNHVGGFKLSLQGCKNIPRSWQHIFPHTSKRPKFAIWRIFYQNMDKYWFFPKSCLTGAFAGLYAVCPLCQGGAAASIAFLQEYASLGERVLC